MIDQPHMTDQVLMIGHKERSNSRDRSRDRSGRSKGRNQSSRERRNNSGTNSGLYCEHCKMTNHDITHCFKLQKTLKKKGIEWSEMNKKVKDDQELYQKFMKLNQQTKTGFLVRQRQSKIFLSNYYFFFR